MAFKNSIEFLMNYKEYRPVMHRVVRKKTLEDPRSS